MERWRRRSIRLPSHDYRSSGWYFVTLCTHERQPLLARPVGAKLVLTPAGRFVDSAWTEIPHHFRHVSTDAFVVMPDHIHGILVIHGAPDCRIKAGFRVAPGSLGAVVRSFKAAASRRINATHPPLGPVWQRNYYEAIIRDQRGLNNVRRYITNNPRVWFRRSR